METINENYKEVRGGITNFDYKIVDSHQAHKNGIRRGAGVDKRDSFENYIGLPIREFESRPRRQIKISLILLRFSRYL